MFMFFFFLAMVIYIPLLFYVGYRLWPGVVYLIPSINKKIYWLIYIGMSALFLTGRFLRNISAAVNEGITIFGYYWVTGIFYLFAIFLLVDLINVAARFTLKKNKGVDSPYTSIIAVVLVSSLFIYGTWNAYNPVVNQYEITISKKANNFKELHAVMVSDLHLSKVVNNKRLQDMISRINSLDPDIVLIPGDIIEDVDTFIEQNMLDTFRGLKAKYGVYLSLGNHEYYGGNVKDTVESLEEIGFHILKDQYLKVADSFYIVGREDQAVNRSGNERKELREILQGVDKSLPLLLLDHQPNDLEVSQAAGIDLQVSGHTHRGQVFPANLITSRLFEQDWGYLQKENMQLIVSCGYGTWGPPMRIGNKPEIVDIRISFSTSDI